MTHTSFTLSEVSHFLRWWWALTSFTLYEVVAGTHTSLTLSQVVVGTHTSFTLSEVVAGTHTSLTLSEAAAGSSWRPGEEGRAATLIHTF